MAVEAEPANLGRLPSPALVMKGQLYGWSLSGFHTFRRVFLFAPSAPTVQIFIPAMWTFDRSQLVIEIQRFTARRSVRNRNDSPARSALAQPACVDLSRHHLLRRFNIDVAQWS